VLRRQKITTASSTSGRSCFNVNNPAVAPVVTLKTSTKAVMLRNLQTPDLPLLVRDRIDIGLFDYDAFYVKFFKKIDTVRINISCVL
jgi:hypothetical protein